MSCFAYVIWSYLSIVMKLWCEWTTKIRNCAAKLVKIVKISDEVIEFIEETMNTFSVELIAGWKSLVEVKIQRSTFQGNALLPLLFVKAMKLLNHILRNCTGGYNFLSRWKKWPYVHGRRQTGGQKEKKRIGNIKKSVRICSQGIWVEFSIKICAMQIMRSGKRHMMKGMERRNQEKIRTLGEKETYK